MEGSNEKEELLAKSLTGLSGLTTIKLRNVKNHLNKICRALQTCPYLQSIRIGMALDDGNIYCSSGNCTEFAMLISKAANLEDFGLGTNDIFSTRNGRDLRLLAWRTKGGV